jgi:glycosyltransferase involved in cell wall biosynthesis
VKLAFVIQRYGADFVGGAEKYVHSMATGFAAEGHDVTVISSCATSYEDWADVYPPGRTEEDGVVVHRLPVRAPRRNDRFIPLHLRAVDPAELPLWPWAQERWAQTMGPDLAGVEPLLAEVAATHDATVLVGYHYAQTLRLTEVAAAHGPTIVVPTAHPEGAFHVGRVRRMFEHADGVVCLSPEEADLVARTHGRRDRIELVPAPVAPFDRPRQAAIDAALRRHGVTEGGYGIVVGRVDPAKGSDDATRYSTAYRRSVDPAFRLVVVGPGGAGGSPDEGIVATGFVDDETKTALVAGAGVVIQPSYMESFSLALMEGWLLGRPALIQRRSRVLAGHAARSGGGLAYDGYLDFEACLTAVRRSDRLAGALGARGRAYVLEEFAWDKVSAAFTAAVERTVHAGDHRLARRRMATR